MSTRRDRLRRDLESATALSLDALARDPGATDETALAAAAHLLEVAEQSLHVLVSDARRAGLTWAAIGDILGISRQGVQRRFAGQVPERVQKSPLEVPPGLVDTTVELLDAAADWRLDVLTGRASAHLLAKTGGRLEPAFDPVRTIFGEFKSREDVEGTLLGRLLRVTAIERRSVRDARVEVTVALDGTLHGIHYRVLDAG